MTISQLHDDGSEMIARLRNRETEASEAVFARYAEQLARLADQHLNGKVKRRVDGDDVVQSVFRTFFGRVERGEYQINSSDQLWKLLVQITLHKAAQQGRAHTAAKRDGRREADGSAVVQGLVSRSPEITDALLLNEAIDCAVGNLPSKQQPRYRMVLELTLAGFSNDDIAERLGIVRRTVERMLVRFQSLLEANFR